MDEVYLWQRKMEVGAGEFAAAQQENIQREEARSKAIIICWAAGAGRDRRSYRLVKSHSMESLESCGRRFRRATLLRRERSKVEATARKRCNDFGARWSFEVAIGELADGLEVTLDSDA